MSSQTAPGQIKAFVERIERLDEELKATNDDKREVYQEARSNGLDANALKEVVRRRRKDPDQLREHETIVELYLAACGTPLATRAHAHEAAPAKEMAGAK